MAVALTALVVAASGVAVGARRLGSSRNAIQACANKKSGVLRLAKKGRCRKRERLVSWNREGRTGPRAESLRGPQGTRGEQGQQGDSATKLWAVVNDDATLERSRGVISAVHLPGQFNVGRYVVTFNQDVSQCAYSATVGRNGVQGEASVSTTGTADQVGVMTYLYAGGISPADLPFHLAVFC
jgi:hypothetical protein